MMENKNFIRNLFLICLLFLIPHITQAAQVKLTWISNPPEEKISSYKLYYGKSANVCKNDARNDTSVENIQPDKTSHTFSLSDGFIWYFSLTAKNSTGEGACNGEINRDLEDPVLTIKTHTKNAGRLSVSGTASDGVEVSKVTWVNKVGGVEKERGTALGTKSWSVADIILYGGENNVTITATDTSGNTSEALLVVTHDTTPPVAEVTVDGDRGTNPLSKYKSTNTFNLNITATDVGGIVVGWLLSESSDRPLVSDSRWKSVSKPSNAINLTTTFTVPDSEKDKEKTIYLWVKDNLGNIGGPVIKYVYWDIKAPTEDKISIKQTM